MKQVFHVRMGESSHLRSDGKGGMALVSEPCLELVTHGGVTPSEVWVEPGVGILGTTDLAPAGSWPVLVDDEGRVRRARDCPELDAALVVEITQYAAEGQALTPEKHGIPLSRFVP